jgi:hypothetical protein
MTKKVELVPARATISLGLTDETGVFHQVAAGEEVVVDKNEPEAERWFEAGFLVEVKR